TETHGSGTNMDNYETKDTRPIIPGTSFSIEPGIYIRGEIGMRTEVDVIIDYDSTVIIPTDYPQQYIHPLYAGA
ncbi:MAG TPA: aminopeptidase P family protein, partial [Candidatus Kapabacteria bacterium]|nr:aminopeptidase P family protein [Candidatus Kapabacteria bacterium]